MTLHKNIVYKLATMLFILGIASLILFKLLGSSIDADGFIHEPFFLMIGGWLFIGLGIFIGSINFMLRCIKK